MEVHWLEKQERHPRYLELMRNLLQVFVLVDSHACNVFGVWTIDKTGFGMPRIVELIFVRKDYGPARILFIETEWTSGLCVCLMNLGLKPSDYRLLRHEKEFGSLPGRSFFGVYPCWK